MKDIIVIMHCLKFVREGLSPGLGKSKCKCNFKLYRYIGDLYCPTLSVTIGNIVKAYRALQVNPNKKGYCNNVSQI